MVHTQKAGPVACPENWGKGGGGGAQSNFPIPDHQNIFHLILI